jgi:DNA-binding CsgD family transcriptional regulator
MTSDQLSDREKEVCCYVVRGLYTKEIAKHLGISHRTVEDHCTNSMKKMGVRNRVELVRKLYRITGGVPW